MMSPSQQLLYADIMFFAGIKKTHQIRPEVLLRLNLAFTDLSILSDYKILIFADFEHMKLTI